MAKITFKCNHCGLEIEWYKTCLHELAMNEIDNKIYCDVCLKMLAHKGIDI